MAPEHLSHYNPHVPCIWEALEQALSSWHPWEGGRLPGMAQPAWIVLAWVPEPYLLMAELLAPPPSSSSPSLPYPIPSFSSPLLLVSLQHYCATMSIFFPSIPSRLWEHRREGWDCCFSQERRELLLLRVGKKVHYYSSYLHLYFTDLTSLPPFRLIQCNYKIHFYPSILGFLGNLMPFMLMATEAWEE